MPLLVFLFASSTSPRERWYAANLVIAVLTPRPEKRMKIVAGEIERVYSPYRSWPRRRATRRTFTSRRRLETNDPARRITLDLTDCLATSEPAEPETPHSLQLRTLVSCFNGEYIGLFEPASVQACQVKKEEELCDWRTSNFPFL